jgi:hypothetical protein
LYHRTRKLSAGVEARAGESRDVRGERREHQAREQANQKVAHYLLAVIVKVGRSAETRIAIGARKEAARVIS